MMVIVQAAPTIHCKTAFGSIGGTVLRGAGAVKRALAWPMLTWRQATMETRLVRARSVDEWKVLLRTELGNAQRARQAHAVAVLRETLAAIDNAEAAEASAAPAVQHGVIAGGVVGLGAGEVPRRRLTGEEVTAIVQAEIEERRAAVTSYATLGRHDEADRMRLQLEVLVALL
jgi:uncharacterized protein YqeY